MTISRIARFVRNHKVAASGLAAILALLILVSACQLWDASASVRGRLAARRDVGHGNVKLLTYGLPVRWMPDYSGLLEGRYGVKVQPVAGCVVTDSLVAYVDAYDRVSTAAANRKFGHDIFAEASRDAERLSAERIARLSSDHAP